MNIFYYRNNFKIFFRERIRKLEELQLENESRNLFEDTLETRIDLLQKDVAECRNEQKLNLASSETNLWLQTKLEAFLETPPFLNKVKSEIRNQLVNLKIAPRNLPEETRKLIVSDLKPEIRAETLSCFEAQKKRITRDAQIGMARAEDLPSAWNMSETKRNLELMLKADLQHGLNVFSDMITELLEGIEHIFSDPINLNLQELKAMDLVMGGRIVLKFFKSLPSSDEGLAELIQNLRIWEVSAPAVKKDKLNALIQALKQLKQPVLAGTEVRIVQEGLPSRMDLLINHLSETTAKNLGSLDVITIAQWDKAAEKSFLESEISSTSVVNPIPIATSSGTNQNLEQSESTTLQTLDKLKERLKLASANLSKSK